MTIVARKVIEGDYLLLNFTGVNYQAHCDNQTVRHNTINAQQILCRSDIGVGLRITFSI